MMLRVSLRSRELLGARTPIFPLAPVPGSERRASEWRGYGMGNGRVKRKECQHGLVGPRRRGGCRLEGDSGSPGGGGWGGQKYQTGRGAAREGGCLSRKVEWESCSG